MSNNKQSSVMDENFDYVKSNEKTLPMLEKIYGDCATDKTATFQVPKNKQMTNNKQSSVEYYINNLIDILGDEICNKLTIEQTNRIHFLGKQAKSMHEEEIMEAHYAPKYGCFSEQYYNETFGDQQ